jgi:hypothetical protein
VALSGSANEWRYRRIAAGERLNDDASPYDSKAAASAIGKYSEETIGKNYAGSIWQFRYDTKKFCQYLVYACHP